MSEETATCYPSHFRIDSFRNGHLSVTIIHTLHTCTSMSNTVRITTSTCSSNGLCHIRQHEAQNAPRNTMRLPLTTSYGLVTKRIIMLSGLLEETVSKLRIKTLLSGFSFQATDLLNCSLAD